MGETRPPPGRGGGTLGREGKGGPREGGDPPLLLLRRRTPGRGSLPTPGEGVSYGTPGVPSHPRQGGRGPPCSRPLDTPYPPLLDIEQAPLRGGVAGPTRRSRPTARCEGTPPSLERSTSIVRRRTTSFVERRRRRRRTRSTSIAYDERRRSSCDVDVDVTRTIDLDRSTTIDVDRRAASTSMPLAIDAMATTIDVDRW